jgi:ATP-dependent Clp protease adaptor protein ClpS
MGLDLEVWSKSQQLSTINCYNMSYTETIEKSATIRKIAPNYRVLLHNDDFNSMEHVVEVLVTNIPHVSAPQAINIMMEAHQYGMALVITCNQEHAEHYSEVLKSHGLTSTIEPAD